MQFEKPQRAAKAHATRIVCPLPRLLAVLLAAISLTAPAAVLAQQPVQTDERNQAAAATAKARTEAVTSQPGAGRPTDTKVSTDTNV